MKLSIILATVNRPTLAAALESIPNCTEVEIVLVSDGVIPLKSRFDVLACRFPRADDFGYSPRNFGLMAATGNWLAFMDDDNFFNPEGVTAILDYCRNATIPAIFRMNYLGTDILWTEKVLREGVFGLPQCVVPNRLDLPRFGTRYAADFDWMNAVVTSLYQGQVSWELPLVVTCPQQNMGKVDV